MTKRDIKGSDLNGNDGLAPLLIELDRLRDALDQALEDRDAEMARQLFIAVNQIADEIDQFASDGTSALSLSQKSK